MAWTGHDCRARDCTTAATGQRYRWRRLAERRRTIQRVLRLEAGSYTIEGIVAIGVFFLLVTLIVQLGFLVLARNVAATSVEAALRRAVSADLSEEIVEDGLARDVRAIVPGANDVLVDVEIDATMVVAQVRFRWIPPGPDFVPMTMSIERSIVRVVPP
jgi:hypothetical protein